MEHNIAEHEASMTVFYSKSTGEIKRACSGIHDFKMFVIDAEDFSSIWSLTVIKKDDNVLQNPNNFKMDLSGAEPILSIKQEAVNQYPVASA